VSADPLGQVQFVQAQLQSGAAVGGVGVEELQAFVEEHPHLLALSGAGISQHSGIPTYRDAVGVWKSNKPIQHGEFIRHHATRQRYWARSYKGWPNVANAKPNAAHIALSQLEDLGYVQTLVTQNIDRLHQKAGHRKVIDLHGRLDQVICMDCGETVTRADVQDWLAQNNAHLDEIKVTAAPDGDAQIEGEVLNDMQVPSCFRCSGLLKPNVVFYGSSVNKEIVNAIYDQLSQADALLVVGTSLMVFSSFRFCKFARENDIPILCINEGLTRADDMLRLKVMADCGNTLQHLAQELPARN
jgi:NAD-dependent SIR2 family protein deacetylase